MNKMPKVKLVRRNLVKFKSSLHRLAIIVVAAAALAGCASTKPAVPTIGEVQSTFSAPALASVNADYTLGPADSISIRTFKEPDLSFDDITVDDSGRISFPLIGAVEAEGKTAEQLAQFIEARLGERYLQNPDVTVVIRAANSRKVVVEGAVARPGVFPISRDTTLLQAIALASGPTEIASLDDILVLRTVDGQKMGAIFNLNEMRRGLMDDPVLVANDTVVVNYSNGRKLYQDLLRVTPLIAAVFRPLTSSN
jgi:polysaccharide export outer membrane protein